MSQDSNDFARSPWQRKVAHLSRLMICVALLSYVLLKYDAASVFQRLLGARIHWLAVALATIYMARLLSSLKWKSILRSYGQQASLLRLFRLYIEAGFFNIFHSRAQVLHK